MDNTSVIKFCKAIRAVSKLNPKFLYSEANGYSNVSYEFISRIMPQQSYFNITMKHDDRPIAIEVIEFINKLLKIEDGEASPFLTHRKPTERDLPFPDDTIVTLVTERINEYVEKMMEETE